MSSLIKIGKIYFGKLRDLDGKTVRYSTKKRTERDAAVILNEWERRVAAGLPAKPDDVEKRAAAEARKHREAVRGLTLHGLCKTFIEGYSRPSIKSMAVYWRTYGGYIRHGIQEAPIAALPATTVKRSDVEKWRDEYLVKRYAPRTVNVVLGMLGTVYNWALDRELLNVRNPCRGVEDVPVKGEAQSLTLAHVRDLLKEGAAEALRVRIDAVLHAGLRHGELAALRWEDVALKADTPHLVVRRSYRTTPKNDKPRTIPLHPLLLEALTAWQSKCPKTGEGFVFPEEHKDGHGGAPGYRMARRSDMHGLPDLLRAAGCPVPTETIRRAREPNERAWHALRHVFLTRCRDCGVPRDVISEFAGHGTKEAGGAAVTAVYLHDTPEHLQRLAAELGRLWYVTPPAPPEKAPEDPPKEEAAAPPPPAAEGEGAEIVDLAAVRAARARWAG